MASPIFNASAINKRVVVVTSGNVAHVTFSIEQSTVDQGFNLSWSSIEGSSFLSLT